MYQAFYNIIRKGVEVPAEAPVSMELADIYSEVFPLMKEDREFFGIIDSKGTTLQAMYHEEEDNYWFEVPRPDLKGSFGNYLTFDEATDLIKSIIGDIPIEGYSGFDFNPW
ncbi:hypothetical protein [Kaarinaea lacus]